MTSDEEKIIFLDALNTWGIRLQMDLLIEEMSGLIKEIIKSRRNHDNPEIGTKVLEEIVDVDIMLDQAREFFMMHGPQAYKELYDSERKRKVDRVKSRLEEYHNKDNVEGTFEAASKLCGGC
jgi:hypothetical protein